jgi:hypothetical protein
LVGKITISVNGMTEPSRTPATGHQNAAPASHAAIDDSRPKAAQGRLHDCGSTIAGRKLGSGYFHSALLPRRMFDKGKVDGGSGEQGTRENRDEFGDVPHQ